MLLITKRLCIREFTQEDQQALFQMIWQKDMLRFMGDWAEHNPNLEAVSQMIQWRKSQQDTQDICENRRYAVALKDSQKLIGMVGMGLEETLGEVELAYFIGEEYQRQGYATEALDALTQWCFGKSVLPYVILTIDCANEASCKVAEKAGYEKFEKRTPISHRQPNMESESYFYFRKYR